MAGNIKKADRWLIGVSGIVLLLALLSLAFDDLFSDTTHPRGETIGHLVALHGDVRVKFGGDVRWVKASLGDGLAYNDTIYSGSESETELIIGEEKLTVSANTLIVLRPQDDKRFSSLNIRHWIERVKNDEFALGEKTEVVVVKGAARLGGKKASRPLPPPRLARSPSPPPSLKPVRRLAQLEFKAIQVLRPKAGAVLYSTQKEVIPFEWTYGSSKAIKATDQFSVEFSETKDFETLFDLKTVSGRLRMDYEVNANVELFYRVRGPKNELSQVEKMEFVSMHPPTILHPQFEAMFAGQPGKPAGVQVEFGPSPKRPHRWIQIASDADFKTVVVNESVDTDRFLQRLPSGFYFLRARSDYDASRLSDWSETVSFQVQDRGPRIQGLAKVNRVVIPNDTYPSRLYSAAIRDVQDYLFEHDFMKDYFSKLEPYGDALTLDFLNGFRPKTGPVRWPAEKILPQTFNYRYQVQKKGRLPSQWSAPEKVEIWLAAPRDVTVDARSGRALSNGRIPLRVQFTPLLFARRYEAQFDDNADFSSSRSTFVDGPEVKFFALRNKSYYWRVRAVTAAGRPVSDFSEAAFLSTGLAEPTVRLSQKEQRKEEMARAPAQVPPALAALPPEPPSGQNATKIESISGSRLFETRSGFWAWVGSGWNSSSFGQSISGRGSFASNDSEPLGASMEVGWGGSTYGASASFNSVPGTIRVGGTTVTDADYNWNSIAAEALYSPFSAFTVLGQPTTFGFRLGVQYQELPFAFLNSNSVFAARTATTVNASAGAMAEMAMNRWRYYWLMRYQYPISLTASGSTLRPIVAFDGSLGTAYYLSSRLKAGLFWSGQWQQFDFTTADSAVSNSGAQILFYSAFDLRLGYDF